MTTKLQDKMRGMQDVAGEMPRYGTWIRKKKIFLFWFLALASVLAAVLIGPFYPYFYFGLFVAIPFAYIAFLISLTAFRLGPEGGDYQNKIHELIIDSIKHKGSILDIGCGSGHLLIKLAKRKKGEDCIGVDYWGNNWEYSISQCQRNARAEGVNHIHFLKASAAKLPFDSSSIANVVSCLTFHEVRDAMDKTESLAEAMRVLAPGGSFVFLDLFDDQSFYKNLDHVRTSIEIAGGKISQMEKLSDLIKLPYPLMNPRVLKFAILISGQKKN